MSQQQVRALIETRLKDWADDNDFQCEWENVTFTPDGSQYLKFNLLPAQTLSDDLAGKLRAFIGVAQITVFMASGVGTGPAELVVDQLDALFPASQTIFGTALNVLILTPVTPGNGFPDEAYYAVPVSFQYRADVALT